MQHQLELHDIFDRVQTEIGRLDSGSLLPLSREFRTLHSDTLKDIAECMERIIELHLFSPNEEFEDVTTMDLKYFNIDYYAAHVFDRAPVDSKTTAVLDRANVIKVGIRKYIDFILLMDQYKLGAQLAPSRNALMSVEELLPQGRHGAFNLETLRERLMKSRSTDARQEKIKTHRYIASLREQLDASVRVISSLSNQSEEADEAQLREVELRRLQLHQVLSWEAIKTGIDELEMLKGVIKRLDPSQELFVEDAVPYVPVHQLHPDTAQLLLGRSHSTDVEVPLSEDEDDQREPPQSHRTTGSGDETASFRLHGPSRGVNSRSTLSEVAKEWRVHEERQSSATLSTRVESANAPPGSTTEHLRSLRNLLGPEGRPNRPFTIVDERTRISRNVFGTGQHLPTVTVEELLEKELAGGLMQRPAPKKNSDDEKDSDDDAATEKARKWDEFTEANPKGSGNTLNLG